jgi:beta-N-acetylhexosaminidase
LKLNLTQLKNMTLKIPLGPVMGDVVGPQLTADDITRLQHPLMGGVILFARNYESPEQLKQLTSSIHALREPALLIAVDHEGGRVQRFREGFTTIPPMRVLGQKYQENMSEGLALARALGYIMAAELSAHGIDFSFAPVLDLDWGESGVIGDRAFHRDADIVTKVAGELIAGLHDAGGASCGKHFPGHGFVKADSHHEISRDERAMAAIAADDLMPFKTLASELDSVMPAHVIYEQVDSQPAGFSPKWLKQILRAELGFEGVIFSDDLSMEGASFAGGVVQRAQAAFGAGCDMVLFCNDQTRCDELLSGLLAAGVTPTDALSQHLTRMRARSHLDSLATDKKYLAAQAIVAAAGI